MISGSGASEPSMLYTPSIRMSIFLHGLWVLGCPSVMDFRSTASRLFTPGGESGGGKGRGREVK